MSDSDDKKDLTAIENLSDFFHEDDPETDSLFEEINNSKSKQDIDDSNSEEDFPPEFNIHEELESSESETFEKSEDIDPFLEDQENQNDDEKEDLEGDQEDSLPDFEINETTAEDGEEIQEEATFDNFTDTDEDFMEQAPKLEVQEDPEVDHLVAEDPNELFDSFTGEDEVLTEVELTSSDLPEADSVIEEVVSPPAKKVMPPSEKEDFIKDMKSFNDNFSVGSIAFGGNPPFAIVLKNIKFKEDGEDILNILKDTKLINDKNQKDYEYGIEQGALLISQISEFSAIFLAHKFRRFDIDISVGLADELHISKNYSGNPKGLISKESLDRVKSEYVDLKKYSNLTSKDIITTTTETIEGHHIAQYLGVISSSDLVSESMITEDREALSLKYKELTQFLKEQAVQMKANGVLNISFNLSKLPEKSQYHIICTGNAVRLKRKI